MYNKGDRQLGEAQDMTGLFDLSGKTALVTGGNSGLGLAYARGMARQGSDIVIWGRNPDKNAAASAELAAFGVKVLAQEVDVTSEEQIVAGFAEAVAWAGRIDTVVQNAGFANAAPAFTEISTEQFRSQIEVALSGGFFTLRTAARHMVARAEAGDPGGSIILCGSGTIFAGTKGLEHYGAAKAGLAAMMRGMAAELGAHGIRVNMIAPGYIKTDLGSGGGPDEMFASRTPLGRAGRVADVEGAAAYLASDAASFHSGDILNIDGGWLASYF